MVNAGQISAIQGHWKSKVKPNLQAVGNAFFVKYFAANPDHLPYFKKFSNVAVPDLPSNKDFNDQTLAVFNHLDKVVAGLGGNAVEVMKSLESSHSPRGVGQEQFKRVFDFIPGFIGENGGDEACVEAWKAAGAELVAALK